LDANTSIVAEKWRRATGSRDAIRQNQLRRNFFRLLSFETIFILPTFALQCGMHASPGCHQEKSIVSVIACGRWI